MTWFHIDPADLEGLKAYTRQLGEDLAKRSAWCAWMLDHITQSDWRRWRDEFEKGWAVRQALKDVAPAQPDDSGDPRDGW